MGRDPMGLKHKLKRVGGAIGSTARAAGKGAAEAVMEEAAEGNVAPTHLKVSAIRGAVTAGVAKWATDRRSTTK